MGETVTLQTFSEKTANGKSKYPEKWGKKHIFKIRKKCKPDKITRGKRTPTLLMYTVKHRLGGEDKIKHHQLYQQSSTIKTRTLNKFKKKKK